MSGYIKDILAWHKFTGKIDKIKVYHVIYFSAEGVSSGYFFVQF